jgi:hypothetical protein
MGEPGVIVQEQPSASESQLKRTGITGVSGVDLDSLNALVTELEATPEKHDSEFDGWGPEPPPESS